jgi:acetyltransferase-like isoleucine patch superfamily enzyme
MMLYMRLINAVYAKVFGFVLGHQFGNFGRSVSIVFPAGIEGSKNINIGNNVYVAYKSYLAAKPHTGAIKCLLEIGDGCRIGRFNHIYATRSVVIGANVLTANGVYISDNSHGYIDLMTPVMNQSVIQKNNVEIGEGSWLGHNACIIGARIGRHCVIGANSVVTHDIPDLCVVVGAPAIIIRRYDPVNKSWRTTHPDGSFRSDFT